MARKSALHENVEPIGLSREAAAEYIGVGVTLFAQMVDDGRMPKPKEINNRLVWNREALRRAFEALPDRDTEAGMLRFAPVSA